MQRILAWIEAHKIESGGLILVVIVALYLLLHKSSGGAPAQSDASSGGDPYAAQLQLAQLDAQAGAQQAQIAQQANTANLAAQVQNNQTQAQLQAQEDQYAAAIQAAEIQAGVTNTQTGAQVQIAGLQAQVSNTQTSAAVQENHDNLEAITGLVSSQNQVQIATIQASRDTQLANTQAAVDINGQQYDYLNNVADLTAALHSQQLSDSTTLSQDALAHVTDVNGSQNRVAIIGAALGQQGTAVAAEQGQTESSISSDNLIASATSSLSKLAAGLFI